ncbi:MAG TPA: hypothetical protein VH764_17475 [Gemmatimonadales bacterium]
MRFLSAIKMAVAFQAALLLIPVIRSVWGSAQAITIGMATNTALKLVLVLSLGSPRFRRLAAPGLLALGVATVAGLAFIF